MTQQKRPQFNVTFNKNANKDQELYAFLLDKLKPIPYIKEKLYEAMLIEQGKLTVSKTEPKVDEVDVNEDEHFEDDNEDFDLDVNIDDLPII